MTEETQLPARRPTLAEYAAMANGNKSVQDPWRCPQCGYRIWKTVDSREKGGPRKRERRCRKCGCPIVTYEIPVPDGYRLEVVPDEGNS